MAGSTPKRFAYYPHQRWPYSHTFGTKPSNSRKGYLKGIDFQSRPNNGTVFGKL